MIPSLGSIALVAIAFVAMEPVTYVVHRWVMHGPGMVWHRSHHARRQGRFERNDWYPVVFASTTITIMALGALVPAVWFLLPIGVGITAYGLAYLFVHDIYIHRRVGRVPTSAGLEHLADAHALHHRYGAEPYGMLVPIVPAALRARADASGFRRVPGSALEVERVT